jgi:hypothetical protein
MLKRTHATLQAIAVCAILLLLLVDCSYLSPPEDPGRPDTGQNITLSIEPLANDASLPTETAQPTGASLPTSTPESPSCVKWDQITLDMVGQVVCVYGVAYSHQGQSRIDFSPEKDSFFLIDMEYYYPELTEGSCVVAKQVVEVYDSRIPFMTLNADLYKCEPWMLE